MNGLVEFLKQDQEGAEKFLHGVVDEMKGDDILWSRRFPESKNVEETKKGCVSFFKKIVGESLSKEQVVSLLQSGEYLSGEALKQCGMAVIQVWSSRREEIQKVLVNSTSNQFGESYLRDFDWKVYLTLSSDKISTLRDPLLLLNLALQNNDKKGIDQILIELPKDSLQSFIHSLEEINEVVQDLRV
eukprot:TRINITY_DN190_c0_g1_i1.p1 TRINITY_DN190_c0_g1~~TRINITY_DN190_c0_g1_i1.p1  ORF type:complete len:187 (-),score=47.80 TRINITY_DN190_c0_g1_i1:163-723(-)